MAHRITSRGYGLPGATAQSIPTAGYQLASRLVSARLRDSSLRASATNATLTARLRNATLDAELSEVMP